MVDLETGRIIASSGSLNEPTVVLVAVGDVTLEADLQEKMRSRGPCHPFEEVRSFFARADLVFGNLESPISLRRGSPIPYRRINFVSDPFVIEGLGYAGFNVLSVANNHMMDYGPDAMLDTIALLDAKGIRHAGAGSDLKEARSPVIIEHRGVTIAFLAYTSIDEECNATPARPGTAPALLELMGEDVAEARGHSDLVVVSIHRGTEFVHYPEPRHQVECRRLVGKGAGLILGHHPHFVQGVELYKGGLIAHSLGSFLPAYEPPLTRFEAGLFLRSRRKNFILEARVGLSGLAEARAVPCYMDNDHQARLADGPGTIETLKLLREVSIPLCGEGANQLYWLQSKDFLKMQVPGVLLAIRRDGARALPGTIRWLLSDRTLFIGWGWLFGRVPPEWVMELKNRVMGLYSRWLAALRGGQGR